MGMIEFVMAFIPSSFAFLCITYLTILFGLFDMLEHKYSRSTARKLLLIIPIIVAVVGGSLIGAIVSNIGGDRTDSFCVEDIYGHDEFDAEVIAEKIVKNNLKSPSTAEFCKHSEYTITCSGNTWTVKGYVDAQNSFGATMRNEFTVKFTFISAEKYTIDYCNIK